jgi:signal transduction histidine kinase
MLNNFLFFVIGGAALINLFIGFYALINDYKRRLNQLFFYLTIGSAIWISFNFLMGFWPNIILLKSAYAFGVLVVSLGVIWVSYLVEEKLNLFKAIPIFLIGVILFLISYINDWIIKSTDQIYLGGFEGEVGPLFFIYLLFVLFAVIIIGHKLIIGYKKSTNIKKIQLKYILIGGVLFIFISFIVSFLLPFFGYKKLMSLDSVSSLFFTGFIFLAVFKYKFLNPKAIATALLTFAIWVFLFIKFLFSNNLQDWLINGSLLVLTIVFGLLLIRSVLKEVRHREEVEKLYKQVDELSKYKSELISVVAHQIKNPLAVIKGYATLIKDKTISDPKLVSEVVQKIQNAANKLIDLLNNLLNLSHIEEGKMNFDFSEIELNKFLKDIADDFQFVAQQKGLELVFTHLSQEILIKGDSHKLSQVFRNLIDNALKYTERGWVKIQCQLKENNVLISINDSGFGMSKELIGNLFQKFSRGVKEDLLGSGLGLYIGKEIVLAHQGKIWAESPGENKGSSFYVELPTLAKLF